MSLVLTTVKTCVLSPRAKNVLLHGAQSVNDSRSRRCIKRKLRVSSGPSTYEGERCTLSTRLAQRFLNVLTDTVPVSNVSRDGLWVRLRSGVPPDIAPPLLEGRSPVCHFGKER